MAPHEVYIITSPGYPNVPYSSHQQCGWTVDAPEGHVVVVKVIDLDLEDTPNCSLDNVTLYGDGETPLGVFCGDHLPPQDYFTSGRNLGVLFRTDKCKEKRGFKLQITVKSIHQSMYSEKSDGIQTFSDCPSVAKQIRLNGGVVEMKSKDFDTSAFYESNMDCQWILIGSENLALKVSFVTLDIENDPSCRFDRLEFHDGVQKSDPTIEAPRCGKALTPIVTPGNLLYLRFYADSYIEGKGFHILIEEVEKLCREDEFNCGNYACVPIKKVCDSKRDCSNGADESKCNFVCGKPLITPAYHRIVGGYQSVPHSWPWMSAIYHLKYKMQFCGASLISRHWILTAAHCLTHFKIHELEVWLGKHDMRVSEEMEQKYKIAKIIIHKGFDSHMNNDIALIKLDGQVRFDAYVIPICLPSSTGYDIKQGTVLEATGWGLTKDSSKTRHILNEVQVTYIDREKCNTKEWYRGQVSNNMLCAGYEKGGRDSCQGDSGGPLVYKLENNQFVQVGITSWGDGCASAKRPGVYTRVNRYTDWIRDTINKG